MVKKLVGKVESRLQPTQSTEIDHVERAWRKVETSLDLKLYRRFVTSFSNEPRAFEQVIEAEQRIDLLQQWQSLSDVTASGIDVFRQSNLDELNAFVAFDRFTKTEMINAAAAERKVKEEQEAAEAEARRKAEEERRAAEEAAQREREELELRLGAAAAKARQAAVSDAPVSERIFRLDLSGVASWPKPEMVAIPPGTFLMGSPPDEEKRDQF